MSPSAVHVDVHLSVHINVDNINVDIKHSFGVHARVSLLYTIIQLLINYYLLFINIVSLLQHDPIFDITLT